MKIITKHDNVDINILCFPYGGEGASMYQECFSYVRTNYRVVPIQLPGREDRFLATPISDMKTLINDLLPQVLPWLDKSIALFGHCVGGLIAYELIGKLLEDFNREVIHLFVSSCPAPQVHRIENPKHHLPPDQFLKECQKLVRENSENQLEDGITNDNIARVMYKTLYSDFVLYEKYMCSKVNMLHCPITVFTGNDDSYVKYEQLEAWQQLTDDNFSIIPFSGKHFYIKQQLPNLFNVIDKQLAAGMLI